MIQLECVAYIPHREFEELGGHLEQVPYAHEIWRVHSIKCLLGTRIFGYQTHTHTQTDPGLRSNIQCLSHVQLCALLVMAQPPLFSLFLLSFSVFWIQYDAPSILLLTRPCSSLSRHQTTRMCLMFNSPRIYFSLAQARGL